jgi:peptide/nickel transport system permease protein
VQYGRWLSNFAHGNFGQSHAQSRPVSAVVADAIPNTLLVMVPGIVVGLVAGIALGTWQAARRHRTAERVSSAVTLALVSIPDFVLVIVILTVFSLKLGLAPSAGIVDPVFHDSMSFAGRVMDVASHLVLPVLSLALLVAVSLSRYQRTAVIGVLNEDFIRTAYSKGATEWRVVLRHALRNSLGPAISIGGLLLPAMFGGAVFIEKIFGIPGIGLTLVNAVGSRDYAVVQAIVLIGTALVTLSSAASDACAALVNPRARLDA